ncbi:hypothetical protein HU200_026296 [Digitaria exilis]|uniref:Uncharacterized protein n=1 Tax=Digitaria exilis TaxID=1010633 RepID=A0A835EUJ9_9POAL|nr:hypothetical protein HU200_026296 [Digitaria exilis]
MSVQQQHALSRHLGMKGGIDDFKVMLTRNEPLTGLAKAVVFLVIFALGVEATSVPSEQQQQRQPWRLLPSRPRPSLRAVVAPTRLMHDMTDEELFWRATLVRPANGFPFRRVPKVAFLFLAGHGVLPRHPSGSASSVATRSYSPSYVHGPPGVSFNVSDDSPFYRRQIPSKSRESGCWANALLDFSNERFVLVSESCIPGATTSRRVYSLSRRIRAQLPVRNRYSRWMAAGHHARQCEGKGPQWFELGRDISATRRPTTRVYPPCSGGTAGRGYLTSDESLPWHDVRMTLRHPARSTPTAAVTYVDWSTKTVATGGVHMVRGGDPRRTADPCTRNSRPTNVCYLFARKFTPDALAPLLNMSAAVMEY